MNWSRRELLEGGGAVLGCALVSGSLRAQPSQAPIATTGHGKLRGDHERGVLVFRGVPYGGSVSGPTRRFKAPPPPPSWIGIRDATAFGAPSVQPGRFPGEPAPVEDCLFLNIWTPALDGAPRPVMFYNHGGGFTIGSGNRPYQNGANLARRYNVVVVESNHRLGALGYLYLGQLLGPEYQGNQGLLDLAAALRWVHDNIAAFGGDRHNVMIFGESGGGGKTACLYTMPAAAPFYRKASIESAIGPSDRTPEQATAITRAAMRALGLTDPRALLEIPATELLRFQTGEVDAPLADAGPASKSKVRDQLFWPFVDGTILPEQPFRNNAPAASAGKPLIVGGCRDEAVFFNMGDPSAFSMSREELRSRIAQILGERADEWIRTFSKTRPGASPSQLYMAITTATPWRAHAVHIAEDKARQAKAPVFSYILDYQSPVKVPGTNYPSGSPHASDIVTKFANVAPSAPEANKAAGPFDDTSPARVRTSNNMSAMWAAFARTGNPSIPSQPEWKPYTLARRETMLIDAECRLVADPEGDERRFWETQPDPEAAS